MKFPKRLVPFAWVMLSYMSIYCQIAAEQFSFQQFEVPVYRPDPFALQVSLPLAYASAELSKTEDWEKISHDNWVYEVDLVFTKYPKDFSRWRTDYDQLLNDRLRAIIALDSVFLNPTIRWNLILQTQCKSESEAIRFFHGFVVKYRPKKFEVIDEVKSPQDLHALLEGTAISKDSTVIKVIERHPEWRDMLVVVDWTGSMYQYGAQLILWHKANLSHNRNRTQHLVFFNDGNAKKRDQKVIGKTGGIYFSAAENIEKVVLTMEKVMLKGGGGDPAENDMEALLKATNMLSDYQDVILIADNKSDVRDLQLLSKLNKPVHIILCGIEEDNYINTDYVKIAYHSGGSLHTIEDDMEELKELQPGERIAIGNMRYEIRNGNISQIAKRE